MNVETKKSAMPNPLDPISASIFHAGSTCPYCQESITAGQLIVTCPQCSSVHHETCWMHKNGCSSYHCDKAVSGNAAAQRPDFTIAAAELANVYVPPPPQKRSAQEVAAAFLPKKPTRLSRMAIISVSLAACSLAGIVGALSGSILMLTTGVIFAVAAVICGVLALLFINNTDNRIYGFPLAGGSVLATVLLTVIFFACISTNLRRNHAQMQVDMKMAESMPSEEQLAAMSQPLRDAMRANVVIKCGSLTECRYGSGVVLKLQDNKAYLITNKHVLGGQKSNIDVMFYNGEKSSATVDWSAPGDVDIAIIRCRVFSLDKYKPIEVLESRVGPGEKVFAVGNPMGLSWSYSEGSISSVRTNNMGGKPVEMYQTQTPINSGNSGGGLYTTNGVLLGINTLTHDKSTAEGLSFALTTAGILELMTPEQKSTYIGKSKPGGTIKILEKDKDQL